MSCKWCGSKQAFNDETRECRDCHETRKCIERVGMKTAYRILFNQTIDKGEPWDSLKALPTKP